MREWFELLTDRPEEEIAALADPEKGNPRDAKLTLGQDIVAFYHGADAAREAAAQWRHKFSEKLDPLDMAEYKVPSAEMVDGRIALVRLLVLLGWAKSNNEARRMIEGGAITIGPDREKVTDPKATIQVSDG